MIFSIFWSSAALNSIKILYHLQRRAYTVHAFKIFLSKYKEQFTIIQTDKLFLQNIKYFSNLPSQLLLA